MKESNILVSILVPTYNRVKYLKECLDSIIEQEGFVLKELELIVSDNSEGNETKEFMDKYIKDHNDWNIKYNKNEKNVGMVGNWNKLLELKKGEYFVFLSDDDRFYDKDSLKELYSGIKMENFCLCCGKKVFIDEMGNLIGEKIDPIGAYVFDLKFRKISFRFELINNMLSFGGILFKASNLKFDEDVGTAADRCFNLKNLNKYGDGIILHNLCFCYRIHKSQLSETVNIKRAIKYEKNIWNNLGINGFTRIYLYIKFLLASLYGKFCGKVGENFSFFLKKTIWK